MTPSAAPPTRKAFAALRQLARPRTIETPAVERCELCSLGLAERHRHLLEIATRKILCACDACALTFQGVEGGRFKAVPRDLIGLLNFRLSDGTWASLGLPINLAFICEDSTNHRRTAFYPSPAGMTDCTVSPEVWEALADANPALRRIAPDVEALMIHRLNGARDYFIAPIDRCYEVAGLVRSRWRGMTGGDALWEDLRKFFSTLKEEARWESGGLEVGCA